MVDKVSPLLRISLEDIEYSSWDMMNNLSSRVLGKVYNSIISSPHTTMLMFKLTDSISLFDLPKYYTVSFDD